MVRTVLLVLVMISTASAASAQTFEGPAPGLRDFHAADAAQGTTTTRRSDSVLNGALIGAGVGVASGLFLCRLTEPWENCFEAGPMLGVGAIGAGIGIAIDLLIRGKTIDPAPPGTPQITAAPMVGRRRGGLRLAFNF